MGNPGVSLNPLTKLRIYREARKIMFAMLDRSQVTAERLDTVMSYVKTNVVRVGNPQEAKKFYESLGVMFQELSPMCKLFEREEDEKTDRVLAVLVENLMNKGDFDLAQRIMDEIKELEQLHGKGIEEIRNQLPEEFDKAVLAIRAKE